MVCFIKKKDYVKHVYYLFVISYDEKIIGISRDLFCEALKLEGIPCGMGYVKPLYYSPLYTEKRAYAFKHYTGNVQYEKGICPVTEQLNQKKVITFEVCRPPATFEDMDDIINSIKKIIESKNELTAKKNS